MLSSPERALALARHGMGLGARVAIVGGVLLLEKSFLNLFVDFASAQSAAANLPNMLFMVSSVQLAAT